MQTYRYSLVIYRVSIDKIRPLFRSIITENISSDEMNNPIYQKQHHRIYHRPRPTTAPPGGYSSNIVYHINQPNNSPYIFNQYTSNATSNNNSNYQYRNSNVYKDFDSYNANLNDYNRRTSFRASANNNNYANYEPNSLNYTWHNRNNSINNNSNYNATISNANALNAVKRNYSLSTNKNYYDTYNGKINYNENDLIWKGMLPANHYQKLVGPNAQVIQRKPSEKVQFNQRVDVKHLIPPSTPPPGI